MMKRIVQSTYFSLLIFSILLPANTLCLEGFATGTLVDTAQGMTPIEAVTPCTPVVPYYVSDEVIEVCRYTGQQFIRITIEDTVIDAAHNQRFYSVTRREWIKAEDLAPCEKLLCANRSAVMIDDVEKVHAPVVLHSLSTKRAHKMVKVAWIDQCNVLRLKRTNSLYF